MTHVDTLVPAGTAGPPRPPGFLLAPFGWAAEPLAAIVHAEPSLLPDLFTISRPRMHLIALALARQAVPTKRQSLASLRGMARKKWMFP
jgi:hypothetical protein